MSYERAVDSFPEIGTRVVKMYACYCVFVPPLPAVILASLLVAAPVSAQAPVDLAAHPYLLDTGLLSRSISFENPTGAPGEGGKAASNLGVGRKGAPSRSIKPGETVPLCDIEGPGTIRHIWMTTRPIPKNLRSLVLRAWWDDQEHLSIGARGGFRTLMDRRAMHGGALVSLAGWHLAADAVRAPAECRSPTRR